MSKKQSKATSWHFWDDFSWYWNVSKLTNQFLVENVYFSSHFLSVLSIYWKFWKWYHLCLTSNISGKTWSILTFRGCFGILRTCRFQNWIWTFGKVHRRYQAFLINTRQFNFTPRQKILNDYWQWTLFFLKVQLIIYCLVTKSPLTRKL